MSYGYSSKERNTPPCKGCVERFSGCHSQCERYNSWVQEERNKKFLALQSINPTGCGYFKEKYCCHAARTSKRRYR